LDNVELLTAKDRRLVAEVDRGLNCIFVKSIEHENRLVKMVSMGIGYGWAAPSQKSGVIIKRV